MRESVSDGCIDCDTTDAVLVTLSDGSIVLERVRTTLPITHTHFATQLTFPRQALLCARRECVFVAGSLLPAKIMG